MFIFNDFFAVWHSLYNQPGGDRLITAHCIAAKFECKNSSKTIP